MYLCAYLLILHCNSLVVTTCGRRQVWLLIENPIWRFISVLRELLESLWLRSPSVGLIGADLDMHWPGSVRRTWHQHAPTPEPAHVPPGRETFSAPVSTNPATLCFAPVSLCQCSPSNRLKCSLMSRNHPETDKCHMCFSAFLDVVLQRKFPEEL